MSGFTYPQPTFISSIYNPNLYLSLDPSGFLTYAYAQTLYLGQNDYRLSYISGITAGTVASGVALVPDTNLAISGLGAVSCSSLTVNGATVTATPSYVAGITAGVGNNSKALVLDSGGSITSGITSLTLSGTLSAATLTGTISTTSASQTYITAVGTLSSLTVSGNMTMSGTSSTLALSGASATIAVANTTAGTSAGAGSVKLQGGFYAAAGCYIGGTGLDVAALKFSGTTFNQSYYTSITEGSAANLKAIVLNSSGQITGITYLSGTTLNATALVSGAAGDFGDLKIGGTSVIDTSRDIANVGTIAATSITATLNGTIGSSYGSQPNITSLGTLSSLKANGSVNAAVSAGATFNSTTDCNSHNIICSNPLSSGGVGIAFIVNSSASLISSISPSASIISNLWGNGGSPYYSSNIMFNTRSDETLINGALAQRMIIQGDGKISFSSVTGDGDWNMLKTGVSSTLRFGSALSSRNCISLTYNYVSSSSVSNGLQFNTYGTSNLLFRGANDRISIGNQVPLSKFHITGSSSILYGSWERVAQFENDQSTPMSVALIVYNEAGGSATNGASIGTFTNDPFNIMINGSNVARFNTSGRFMVGGNFSPEATIHSSGEVWANNAFHCKSNANNAYYRWNWTSTNYPAIGNQDTSLSRIRIGICDATYAWTGYAAVYGGAYTNASDRRIKKDIVNIPYGLNEVLKMKPRKYTLIQDNDTYIGFIAQELIDLIPEAVSGDPNSPINPTTGMPPDAMGIDLASLTSVLCKAIQELNEKILSQQAEIKILKTKIIL